MTMRKAARSGRFLEQAERLAESLREHDPIGRMPPAQDHLPGIGEPIHLLDIPDDDARMDPELVHLLAQLLGVER